MYAQNENSNYLNVFRVISNYVIKPETFYTREWR